MKTWKRILFVGIIMALVISFQINPAKAENFRMVVGGGWSADATTDLRVVRDWFCPEVNKRLKATTNHQIDWVPAYATLCKPGECLEAMESGILDIGKTFFLLEPTKLFPHAWSYHMPFCNADPMKKARAGEKMFKQFPFLTEMFEKQYNQKYLGFMIFDSYELLTKFPVKKMEDLKGKKIAGAGINLQWLKAAEAVPVQSVLGEAYTSLHTGVYEGWIMSPSGVAGYKLYEVAKNYTLTNFGANVMAAFNINLNTWKKLPPEVQKVVAEVAHEYSFKLAEVHEGELKQNLDTIKKGGASITPMPAEELQRWAKMMPNFATNFAKEVDAKGMPGTAMMKAWYKILEEEGHVWPRNWMAE
jgi:TRAP-type C4-dicarboxylate transport system substrate-binding protein